jgi:hypothetical protein
MNLPDGFEVLFGGAKNSGDECCPKCGVIATGCEVPAIYDGVCYWRCEACKVKWHRFGKDQPHRRAAVERYWEGRL